MPSLISYSKILFCCNLLGFCLLKTFYYINYVITNYFWHQVFLTSGVFIIHCQCNCFSGFPPSDLPIQLQGNSTLFYRGKQEIFREISENNFSSSDADYNSTSWIVNLKKNDRYTSIENTICWKLQEQIFWEVTYFIVLLAWTS